jgi:hypothetical protein
MNQFYSTRQVAGLLNLKPDTLQKAIWQNRVKPPMKGPSGQYLWMLSDIERASWALLHKAYEPTEGDENGEG